MNGKVCVVMMEAIGESEEENRNAVRLANMEFLESLKTEERSLYYSLDANGNKVSCLRICVIYRLEFPMECLETME